MLRLSVVIPSYNRLNTLPETLAALARQSLNASRWEVIVVDDGSTDGTVAWLQAHRGDFPFELRWIEQERGGPGAARNRGVQNAHHQVLLFLDSDLIAGARTLEAHVALQESNPRALVAGAVLPWPPACTSTYAKIMYLDRPVRGQRAKPPSSFLNVFTANLSVSRREFDQLGGFDEALWAFEDIDLGYRATLAGLPLVFSDDALGYHNHPATFAQDCWRERHYQEQAAAFLRKHPELRGQIRHLVDKEPIALDRDSPSLMVRKVIRRLIAVPAVLGSLQIVIGVLERFWPNPAVLSFLYWKVRSSYGAIGYRAGLESQRKEASP